MNLERKAQTLILQLDENLRALDNSVKSLTYSLEKCSKIDLKSCFSQEEAESFEALTARFARTADILTQKVLKTLFIILRESPPTFIDGANLLEKLGLVSDSSEILMIRDLRNIISHEYREENIKEIFKNVIDYVPVLTNIINNTKTYINNKLINLS